MRKGNMILGVDLLRGNFYINSGLAKTMKGVPSNAKGMVSIDLKDLATPDAPGTYYIDGAPVILTHRQALRMILDQARASLIIPDDTEENLIELARNTPALFAEFFVRPLPGIKEHYGDLAAIHKRLTELEPGPSTTREESAQFQAWRAEYENINFAFADHNYVEASERLLRLKTDMFREKSVNP